MAKQEASPFGRLPDCRLSAAPIDATKPPALFWTLARLDEALKAVGDGSTDRLDTLIDELDAAGVSFPLGVEEPPEAPRAAAGSADRLDGSDPLALLFREAQRRPRPTRDEERRLFRRVVFARRRLLRTLEKLRYPKESWDAFLTSAPCVALKPAERCSKTLDCGGDADAPCVKFSGLCANEIVHERCCSYHEARNTFVVRYLYLVLGMVRRFRDRGMDAADLVQEGSAALLRAAEDFEPARGFRFSTYARWWVNQAFLRTMYNNLRTVRLPVYLQKAASKVLRSAGDRDFRELDVESLSKASGVAPSTIRILSEFSRSTVSIDAGSGDRESALAIADTRTTFKPETLDRPNVRAELERAMDALDIRERTILRMRFGLDTRSPRTLEEVGDALHLSRERVRQIQEEAFAKLRNPFHLDRLRNVVDLD